MLSDGSIVARFVWSWRHGVGCGCDCGRRVVAVVGLQCSCHRGASILTMVQGLDLVF